jgi:hypothetical protein
MKLKLLKKRASKRASKKASKRASKKTYRNKKMRGGVSAIPTSAEIDGVPVRSLNSAVVVAPGFVGSGEQFLERAGEFPE